jgi:hypothetical protein
MSDIPAEEDLQDKIEAGEPPVDPNDSRLRREMQSLSDEELLPIEKQLIAGSLILGVSLLGILLWVSATFFPSVR